jgi:hypothetical protein
MWLMWLATGWYLKVTYDKFVTDVAALKAAKTKEYAAVFQSGLDSDSASGVLGLADAFEQHGEPLYAARLRAHASALSERASRVIVTPAPEETSDAA